MSGCDVYLDVLNENISAVAAGGSQASLMPLLQWLLHWRPAGDEDDDAEYMTSAEIQQMLGDMVSLDLNEISVIMWRLGYRVSVATVHPTWALKRVE